MESEFSVKPRYFIEAAAKTLDVLETFTDNVEQLSITEVARRAKLPYTSAFRFLYTLEKRGYVMRVPDKRRYVLAPSRKRLRVGYAALGKIAFATEVTRSLLAAARRFGIAIFATDNEDNPPKTLSNAEQLLGENINVLIEFQRNEAVSHLIATKCHNANVPAIAINFPQPGAYYFGPDSHRTGWLAGDYLRQFARQHWRGESVRCLVLPSKGLGSTQNTRKVGLLEALRQPSRGWASPQIEFATPGVTAQEGYTETRRFVRKLARPARLLVAAFSDPLAIGSERALREFGLQDRSTIVGQGGTAEVRRHILRGGALRASVAYFPECYGERVLKLATKLFEGEHPPLVTYTDHVVLTIDNLPDFYTQKDEAIPRD
ncbi:MAG TPA: substrate-binding domain-containing protein [Candidatus Dormibacteraeota bacterium]|nr:substrate-binding domain-containing protein [Candidatus Dormibacteraeota bacterium]